MSANFDNFANFGADAGSDDRKELSDAIFESLQKERFEGIRTPNPEAGGYAGVVNSILSDDALRKPCAADAGLAEQVARGILDFVENVFRMIREKKSPYEAERQLLEDFKKTGSWGFKTNWKTAAQFIRETYAHDVFDTDFYHKEFQDSLNHSPKAGKKGAGGKSARFQSVKGHFIEKWEELLRQKQARWESEQIEEERRKFSAELRGRVEGLTKLQKMLDPFLGKFSRLWGAGRFKNGRPRGAGGAAKGEFKKADFNILKKYSKILKKDGSLQELAEMLGRVQEAETEYEEEFFADKAIKHEWKVEHANKADLVGIRESDDIGSMLPSEAALLSNPALKTVFYKKFIEKKLLTFDYQAKTLSSKEEGFRNKRLKPKEAEKGPIIICVDTSGSMEGTPEKVAKTLSYALLKTAIRENRNCYLISFSDGIETLELTDINGSIDKLLGFLSMSFDGGTDAAPALNEAMRMLETEDYKQADIVMVSDFEMNVFDAKTKEKIRAAKGNKTKFHSLLISNPGYLKTILSRMGIGKNGGNKGNPETINEFDNNWIYDPGDPKRVLTLVKNIREGI
jgi:uncharacterized protein with von Willebrand factor type A (vWA) domain